MPNNPNDKNNTQNNYTQNVSPELEQNLGNQQDSTRNANAPVPGSTTNYEDISGDKQSYTPNSQGLSNTGSGTEAALGTDYSWNKQGSGQAQRTYSADVLTAKQNILNNRQTIENNAANYQAQADMMKYQNNQNAEKVGWTGGYVLDQNRQMEYLKASIQAQMYGAMELQKYGYDSSLAAARLSYDLNQQEYAQKYYQEAVSAALSEAQLTGTYFSAETKDMMSQLAVAQQKENDPNLSEEERAQATKIRESIYNWFSSNGISTEGVKTLEAWQQDQANELQWSNELWTRYQAAIEAANTNIAENSSEFIMLDENGKELWDGTNISTGNWDTFSAGDVLNYLTKTGENGKAQLNQQAVQQYYSYLDSNISGQIEAGFREWCRSQGYIKTDENGKETVDPNQYAVLLGKYLSSSDIVDKMYSKFNQLVSRYEDPNTSREDKAKIELLENTIKNWDFTIKLPDGTTKTATYDQLISGNTGPDGGITPTPIGETETKELEYVDSNGAKQKLSYTLSAYTVDTKLTGGKEGYSGSEFVKSTYQYNGENYNICFTTGMVTNVDDPNEQNFDQDDIEVKIYKTDGSGTSSKSGYGVEVADDTSDAGIQFLSIYALYGAGLWEAHQTPTQGSAGSNSILESMYYSQTGKPLESGSIIVVNGNVYFYNVNGKGPYSKGQTGLYGIQKQGCSNGTADLASTLKGSGQWTN